MYVIYKNGIHSNNRETDITYRADSDLVSFTRECACVCSSVRFHHTRRLLYTVTVTTENCSITERLPLVVARSALSSCPRPSPGPPPPHQTLASTSPSLFLSSYSMSFFFTEVLFLFIFRERGREGERDGDKY